MRKKTNKDYGNLAKRRKPQVKAQPLEIEDSAWTLEKYKPLVMKNRCSAPVLVCNGSYAQNFHISWYDFFLKQWRSSYGDEITNVTHWMTLPPAPNMEVTT